MGNQPTDGALKSTSSLRPRSLRASENPSRGFRMLKKTILKRKMWDNWDSDAYTYTFMYIHIIYVCIYTHICWINRERKVGFCCSFNKAFGQKFCCRNLEENCVKFCKEFRVVSCFPFHDSVKMLLLALFQQVWLMSTLSMFYIAPATKSARCLLAGATASVFGLKPLAFLNSPTTLSSLGDIQRILPGKKRDVLVFHFPGKPWPLWQPRKKEPFPQRRCCVVSTRPHKIDEFWASSPERFAEVNGGLQKFCDVAIKSSKWVRFHGDHGVKKSGNQQWPPSS